MGFNLGFKGLSLFLNFYVGFTKYTKFRVFTFQSASKINVFRYVTSRIEVRYSPSVMKREPSSVFKTRTLTNMKQAIAVQKIKILTAVSVRMYRVSHSLPNPAFL